MKKYIWLLVPAIGLLAFFLTKSDKDIDWPEYYGDGNRSHYSSIDQINVSNVSHLKVAWSYAAGGVDTIRNRSQIQTNPIVIEGVLYGVSADNQAFAVEASTGTEIWKSNLKDNGGTTSRGVTYWTDGSDKRIFFGAGQWLYAFDATTGKLIDSFGEKGRIDLKVGIDRPGADNYVSSNTPNTIYENLIITGTRVNESETALLGDIRAYDTRTGELVWTFHTIPKEGEEGYDTWEPPHPRERLGGANPWMGMAIDRDRGIVYAPTGSAAYDFYGGNRKGDNLYANCLLALDAATGKKLWHFQLVRHDIWDRDPPAPPNLLTINRNGKEIDVVVIVTKQGHIFVFDRVTGEPIYPIEQIAFPQEGMPGEQPSPTQPIPLEPKPFTRQSFTMEDFNSFVADKDSLMEVLSNANTGSPYIPITEKMTVFFPGTDGGAQWGGAATDPDGIIYIPSKEIPVYTSLIPKEKKPVDVLRSSASLYDSYCSSCHGKDLSGSHDGTYPGLLGVEERFSGEQMYELLVRGQGMMPSFSHVSRAELEAISNYLLYKDDETGVVSSQTTEIPYQHTGYNRWYDRNGYPVSTPPWGTLTAIDLNNGDHLWQIPLGEYKELTEKGIPITGTDNYGGPLVTSGGVVFIAATRDEKIRAFDKLTGKLLWEHDLPAAGYATPSTYTVNGRQYIVIACGGGKLNTKSGDHYVAFSLGK